MELSVVIPAYNEGHRIQETLVILLEYLRARKQKSEIIVVDDGSRDDTVPRARLVEGGTVSIEVLPGGRHRGKGYSVRRGVMHSTGQRVLVTDADLSVPITQLERLEEALAGGASIALGVRVPADSGRNRPVPLLRRAAGELGDVLTQFAAPPLWGLKDSRCGFKLFRGDVARSLFELQTVDGYGYDPEILYIAQRKGYRLAQVNVDWVYTSGSKVRLWDYPFTALEVARVRLNSATGKYDE